MPITSIVNPAYEITPALSEAYRTALPFPHAVFDNFFNEEILETVLKEFAETRGPGRIFYQHANENKLGFNNFANMGPVTRQVIEDLNSQEFLDWLGALIGLPDLIADRAMDGGGLHEMKRDGFLNIHTDFQSHTVNKTWSRRANLILFLNKGWQDEYNGFLELWDKDVKTLVRSVKPVFNRCVIFSTTDISFHGVPRKIQCPEGESRKSLALYYFQDLKKTCRLKPTNYRPLPEDSWGTKAKVYVDRSMVWAYSFAKRYLGLSDQKVSKILKALTRR